MKIFLGYLITSILTPVLLPVIIGAIYLIMLYYKIEVFLK